MFGNWNAKHKTHRILQNTHSTDFHRQPPMTLFQHKLTCADIQGDELRIANELLVAPWSVQTTWGRCNMLQIILADDIFLSMVSMKIYHKTRTLQRLWFTEIAVVVSWTPDFQPRIHSPLEPKPSSSNTVKNRNPKWEFQCCQWKINVKAINVQSSIQCNFLLHQQPAL